MSKKIYVVDTSSLLEKPESIEELGKGGNIVVIPEPVVRELDEFTKKGDDTILAYSARTALTIIDNLREEGKLYTDPRRALKSDKSSFENGGKVSLVLPQKKDYRKYELQQSRVSGNDDGILFGACKIRDDILKLDKLEDIRIVLISEDKALRVRAAVNQLNAEKLRTGIPKIKEPYEGYSEIQVPEFVIDLFMKSGDRLEDMFIDRDTIREYAGDLETHANQVFVFTDEKNPKNSVMTTYRLDKKGFRSFRHAVSFRKEKNGYEFDSQKIMPKRIMSFTPRDPRQIAYLEFILDPSIQILAVNGRAGTGKTQLLIAGALELLIPKLDIKEKDSNYEYIIASRPEYLSGPPIGFLPGDSGSKLDGFMLPIQNAILYIAKKMCYSSKSRTSNLVEDMQKNNPALLYFTQTGFARGRDLKEIIYIVDEFQNATFREGKTMTSRVGEGGKGIFCGDISQIDNSFVDTYTNALARTIQKIKERNLSSERCLEHSLATITLERNYRSKASGLFDE